MKTPTWKVTVYAPMWERAWRNPGKTVVVEAYASIAAEEEARRPNWKVIRCERLTGFGE
jgi:hypothetical protein